MEAQCPKVSGARHAAWHSGTQEMPGEDIFHLKVWPTLPEAEHRAAASVMPSLRLPSCPAFSRATLSSVLGAPCLFGIS